MALWDDELTLSPQYIASHPVFCAVRDGEVIGFYAVSRQSETCELEHLWVDPQHMRAGIGAQLFEHAVRTVRWLGGSRLIIISDPHAEGFYQRMGAGRVGEAPSRPEGRILPVLALLIRTDAVAPP